MAAHSITILSDMLKEASHLLLPHPVRRERRIEKLYQALSARGLTIDFSDYRNIADMINELEKYESYEVRVPRAADLVHYINRALMVEVARWDAAGFPTKLEDWK